MSGQGSESVKPKQEDIDVLVEEGMSEKDAIRLCSEGKSVKEVIVPVPFFFPLHLLLSLSLQRVLCPRLGERCFLYSSRTSSHKTSIWGKILPDAQDGFARRW
jgi:hypothetical protein